MLVYPHLMWQHVRSVYAGPFQELGGMSQGALWHSAQTGTVGLILLHMCCSVLCIRLISAPYNSPVAARMVFSEYCFGARTGARPQSCWLIPEDGPDHVTDVFYLMFPWKQDCLVNHLSMKLDITSFQLSA